MADPVYVINPQKMTEYHHTVFCRHPDDPRGCYTEEIDVAYVGKGRPSIAGIKRAAQEELDANYEPGMRAVRVRRNYGMIIL